MFYLVIVFNHRYDENIPNSRSYIASVLMKSNTSCRSTGAIEKMLWSTATHVLSGVFRREPRHSLKIEKTHYIFVADDLF